MKGLKCVKLLDIFRDTDVLKGNTNTFTLQEDKNRQNSKLSQSS